MEDLSALASAQLAESEVRRLALSGFLKRTEDDEDDEGESLPLKKEEGTFDLPASQESFDLLLRSRVELFGCC